MYQHFGTPNSSSTIESPNTVQQPRQEAPSTASAIFQANRHLDPRVIENLPAIHPGRCVEEPTCESPLSTPLSSACRRVWISGRPLWPLEGPALAKGLVLLAALSRSIFASLAAYFRAYLHAPAAGRRGIEDEDEKPLEDSLPGMLAERGRTFVRILGPLDRRQSPIKNNSRRHLHNQKHHADKGRRQENQERTEKQRDREGQKETDEHRSEIKRDREGQRERETERDRASEIERQRYNETDRRRRDEIEGDGDKAIEEDRERQRDGTR
ncbi:hypothetical protein KM043_001200 [Ampulex compressa]|nr:hypothetical protein KM043_001200 [Ampulex compressa]